MVITKNLINKFNKFIGIINFEKIYFILILLFTKDIENRNLSLFINNSLKLLIL